MCQLPTLRASILIAVLCHASTLVRSEEFPAGVLLCDPGNLGDKFTEAIPFRKFQKFSVTVTVHPMSGGKRDFKGNQVRSVQYFRAPHGNITNTSETALLNHEMRTLQGFIDKYPKTKNTLEPIKSKYSAAAQMIANGYVRYGSRWITRAEFEKISDGPAGDSERFDLIDLAGNLYQSAKIVNIVHNGIVVNYSAGVKTIPFDHLTKEMQDKYSAQAPPPPEISMTGATKITTAVADLFKAQDKSTISGKYTEDSPAWEPKSMSDAADCVVLIEGDKGNGSGFLVTIDDESYIYTNAHVIAGNSEFKIINRQGDEFFDIEETQTAGQGFADGDMLRFKLKHRRQKGLRLDDGTASITDGTKISAIGNSHGAGVVKVIDGEITGLGPDRIEISSGIVQGNSGGPIVDKESLLVVGVSTFLRSGRDDIWSKGTGFDKVRRFGLRPKAIKSWDTVGISQFVTEGRILEDMKANVRLVRLMELLEVKTNGVYYDRDLSAKGEYLVGDILDEYRDHIIVKNIFKLSKMLRHSGSSNGGREAIKTYGRFLTSTKRQMTDLRSSQNFDNWSFYHRQLLKDSEVLGAHQKTEETLNKMALALSKKLR